jgi:hypothetical protein
LKRCRSAVTTAASACIPDTRPTSRSWSLWWPQNFHWRSKRQPLARGPGF